MPHPLAEAASNVTLEEVPCDHCGSSRRRVLFMLPDWRYRRPDPVYHLCECRDCGLCYLNPRPTADSMAYHYPSNYDVTRRPDKPEVQDRYKAQAEWIGDGQGRLLDVGAASGEFLRWIAGTGWETTGIDPLARVEGQNDVLRLDIMDTTLNGKQFDAVTAWAVMEHVHSPTTFISRVCDLLAPGGRLFLSVPNFDSFTAQWLQSEDVPRHLYFYTRRTVAMLAEKCGMRVVRHSYDPRFGLGVLGRGSFVQMVFRGLGGMSPYEFLQINNRPDAMRQASRVLYRLSRPLHILERIILTPERLQRWGKVGVMAFELQAR